MKRLRRAICIMLSFVMVMSFGFSAYALPSDDPDEPTTIVLSETNLQLVRKQPKYQLVAYVYPESANQKVTWKTSDSKIATISDKGFITTKKVGSCTITATTKNGKTATCQVQVVDPTVPVEGVEIVKEEYQVVVGKSVKLQWKWEPSSPSNKYIKWTVEDNKDGDGRSIVSIDQEGRVTGQYPGDVTIHGVTDDGGFDLEFFVSVNESNDATYDEFEEENPDLKVLRQVTKNEGVLIEIQDLGWLFYNNYDGEWYKGFQQIDDDWYYFEDQSKTIEVMDDNAENGISKKTVNFPFMKIGWVKNLNQYYYFKPDGKMAKSEWVEDNGHWFWVNKSGEMQTGWKYIGSTLSYLNPTQGNGYEYGEAIQGPFVDTEGKYYFGDYGTCVVTTGWKLSTKGKWYFANDDRTLARNTFVNGDGCRYYMQDDGSMLTNGNAPDGSHAGADGKIY